MSEKTDSKKEQIRVAAREVFSAKGFKNVTMKDIVDACGISRGGLYLYYSSTEEILLDVLRQDASSGSIFEEALGRKNTAEEILRLFLKEQKKELLSDSNLTSATYEYGFIKRNSQEMRSTFTDAVQAVEYLIHIGRRRHEFSCADPHAMAVNIMFVIEGMKVSSRCFELTEEEIDKEIDFLLEQLHSKTPHKKADADR
ncbi:MAG: TetR/AcrR family transcriptional regulator [Lachnospiraceae bacterium]|nr:TetR/AcrR family transcriptional regulator [Lachnospiraceae bacterium]